MRDLCRSRTLSSATSTARLRYQLAVYLNLNLNVLYSTSEFEALMFSARVHCTVCTVMQREVRQVLALGVDASRVIISNAFKPISVLRFAHEVGVELTIADCEDELRKLAAHMPHARYVCVCVNTFEYSTRTKSRAAVTSCCAVPKALLKSF